MAKPVLPTAAYLIASGLPSLRQIAGFAPLYFACGFVISWSFHLAWAYIVLPIWPALAVAAIAWVGWWLTGPHR